MHSDPGDGTRRNLEVEWTEDRLEQRLYIDFGADEIERWITELRTRNGRSDREERDVDGELTIEGCA